jgi:hypothetical protein
VLQEDEDPTEWVYVAEADNLAALRALGCIGGGFAQRIPKVGNPGVSVESITRENCAIPERLETGEIYAID